MVLTLGQVPAAEYHRVEVDKLPVRRHPLGSVLLLLLLVAGAGVAARQGVLPPLDLRLEARHPEAILGRGEPHSDACRSKHKHLTQCIQGEIHNNRRSSTPQAVIPLFSMIENLTTQ